jgi:PAS domain S-box-containing protein
MSFLPEISFLSLATRASRLDTRHDGSAEASREPRGTVLATAIARPQHRRLAVVVIALSVMAFLAAAPFAKMPLTPVPAFIPAYESALVVVDLITAVLLFGQFAELRSAALLAVAAGYLFDALMVIPHALSFPGLITPTGWLGAGSQTTAWLYMFWHGGFAIFVIAYAELNRRVGRHDRSRTGSWPVVSVIVAVLGISAFLTLLATRADDLLPAIMAGNGYTPAMKFVVGTVWLLSAAALLILIANRPYAILDLWLMVVMVAWLFDIALSAVLNAGRFDLGFYTGRFFGLLATSFVLAVILVEAGWLNTGLTAEARRRAEAAEALVRRVFETSLDLIVVTDRRGTLLRISPSALPLLGYDPDELVGRSGVNLVYSEDLDSTRNAMRKARRDGTTQNFECRYVHKQGHTITFWWKGVWSASEQQHFFIGRDITERRQTEEQLRQAQKMEAVGNLTGGLAHDFNNLLGVIIGNLDLLQDLQVGNPDVDEFTNEALSAALRGADLTRRLLAFARRQPLQPARIEVNEMIGGIVKLLERTLGEEIRITLDLNPDLWPVVVDPAQLESSLTNLATNARDAMPRGGHLIIVTGNRSLDTDYAAQHPEVQPGDYAMIEVTDTGTGMTPQIASRIFEPFYTTKESGKGTGLGLSMVFGFIKQSGGHINVYSEVGIGTTFRLYLPRAAADAEASLVVSPTALLRGNGETVLAVEDNANLRRVVARQLTELGYRVLEAEDPHTALRILDSEPVDVLFTDIVMPGGTSGYEIAGRVLSLWPKIKVVLTSGFPENRANGDPSERGLRLLSKPYRRDDLARIIREVLDS